MNLVVGATGNVGGELVRALADAGEVVRALSRRPKPGMPEGVEEVVGDSTGPSPWRMPWTGWAGCSC